ncbi:MAG: hypothetical protein C0602_10980 [Denitrovibrio sp.]|nr:MAG: hypothetical protein C0602_10980 [Denitrovibrio sp.]
MQFSQNMSQNKMTAQTAELLSNKGYKLIKGVCEDIDVGNITTSMNIRSGNRLVSLLLPNGEAKISGAEVGWPIYCLMKGKDIFVFRDIKYMMNKILDN